MWSAAHSVLRCSFVEVILDLLFAWVDQVKVWTLKGKNSHSKCISKPFLLLSEKYPKPEIWLQPKSPTHVFTNHGPRTDPHARTHAVGDQMHFPCSTAKLVLLTSAWLAQHVHVGVLLLSEQYVRLLPFTYNLLALVKCCFRFQTKPFQLDTLIQTCWKSKPSP